MEDIAEIVCKVLGTAQESKNRHARSELISTVRNVGSRLACENLDTYKVTNKGQKELLSIAREYAKAIQENVKNGTNVFLYGNSGVGKDHICMGMAVEAYRKFGISTRMVSGYQLRSRFVEAIAEKESFAEIAAWFYDPDILWISDPVEAGNAFNATEMRFMYSIVDLRYKNRRPIWITTNIVSIDEANKAIGAATVDRLRGGSVKMDCDWKSYR
jgi:DNA replication protein DnaC